MLTRSRGAKRRILLLGLLFAPFLHSCQQAAEQAPDAPARIRTTHPEIALSNLDAQINGAERALSRRRKSLKLRETLVELLLIRTRMTGTYEEDFARILVISQEALDVSPDDPASHLLRARVLSALHRFDEAGEHLDRAESFGASPDRVDALRAVIGIAIGGELSATVVRQNEIVRDNPDFTAFADLALTEAALGNFSRADRLYDRALSAYRDSSPFPVATIAFQRGVMWCEMAGDCRRGEMYYREAVSRMPKFVTANVHLAEIEFQTGREQAAIERLERVLAVGSDPEPEGLLSEIFAAQGDSAAAELWADESRQAYEVLLSRHEEAFRDHAAEFFMGPGRDPGRALGLARANLNDRKNDRAYLIAIEASERSAGQADTCDLVRQARNRNPASVPLLEKIESLSGRCP